MSEQATIGFIHGSWHGAWCWELVREPLERKGFETVAVDLAIDDPRATFDDHANTAIKALEGHDNLVLVGHSRGGNIVPRIAGALSVRQAIYVGASFEAATLHGLGKDSAKLPPRNTFPLSDHFERSGSRLLNTLKPDSARYLLYHDCNEEVADWAISRLRASRRTEHEPLLASWPDIPQEYIICTNDRVVSPEWSAYVSRELLGIEPVTIETGHSPFLAQPRKFAGLLSRLVAQPSAAAV